MNSRSRGYGFWSLFFGLCIGSGLLLGTAFAQQTWVDEINTTLNFYKTTYPSSNWEPYSQRLQVVKEAVGRGDTKMVKTEMGDDSKCGHATRAFTMSRPTSCSTSP